MRFLALQGIRRSKGIRTTIPSKYGKSGLVRRSGGEGHPVVRAELIGHAGAGSQYTSITFTDHLADEDIPPSIGSVADAYDTR